LNTETCHEHDGIQLRDVIANRRAVGTFLYAPYWTQTPKSLSFRDT